MTSELKFDLRNFGYAEGMYMGKCRTCLQQYMGDKRSWNCKSCAEVKSREPQPTRAVPDVPELVRYGNYIDNCMHVKPTGEYVRYDQAAAMIAAKDKEIQELKEKLGVVSTERHADAEYIGHLQAELVYLKAQEPVAWMHPEAGWTDVSKAEVSAQCKPSTYPKPLYAAPVDQTAEIERLRGYVAGLVTWIEDEVGAELPFAIDRTALSGKEPS